jgi:hypothetical protein
METEFKEVSLSTLGKGAAAELFAEELGKVLENIADVNTEAKVPREIRLSVKIIPRETRDFAAVKVSCTSKLAALKQYETSVHMGVEGGRVKAFEEEVKQGKLDLNDKVRDIAQGRK